MRTLLALALVAGCGSPASHASKAVEPRRPDVIVITVDTLRADRVGAWGYEAAHTPAIDGLAARGVRFSHAITPQPRTTPGLASLWTGLWPHHNGAMEVHYPLMEGTLISEVLTAQGYETRAVSANPAAGPDTHLDRGFGRFEVRRGIDASEVTDIALELTREVPADQPLLLWAHYFDPHAPYEAPAAAEPPSTPGCHAVQVDAEWSHTLNNRGGISERAWPECSRAYDAEVGWADRQIARLLEGLDALGRRKVAFVVFGSDHGEGMGERDLWYEHGPNVHGSNLNIPLSIAGPGIPAGVVVARAVSLVDVAPTLYALLGVPADSRPEADGASLAEVVRGGDEGEGLVGAESSDALTPLFTGSLISGRSGFGYCLNGERFALCWEDARTPATLHDAQADPDHQLDVAEAHPDEYAVLVAARARWISARREHSMSDGRFKLVERPRLEGGYDRTLFDLTADPRETQDVAADHPDVVARLTEALATYKQDIPGHEARPLTPDQEAGLRALGYIE
ncbi:MAG: sulfatase [Sandaracinaceae bacterium]|nr:sulfatase [Sandaracinaceae bacterium]